MHLFATTAFRSLLERESRLLNERLSRSRERGRIELRLEPPGLGASTSRSGMQLMVDADGMLSGSLRGRMDELPFADDSVDILVIRHVADWVRQPHRLASEALRVLAARGQLLVTGIRPLSFWAPWIWQQAHSTGLHFQPVSAAWWRQRLGAASVNMHRIERFGPIIPGIDGDFGSGSVLSAGFILHAQKQRNYPIHIPVHHRVQRMPAAGSTACASWRRCA